MDPIVLFIGTFLQAFVKTLVVFFGSVPVQEAVPVRPQTKRRLVEMNSVRQFRSSFGDVIQVLDMLCDIHSCEVFQAYVKSASEIADSSPHQRRFAIRSQVTVGGFNGFGESFVQVSLFQP
ncbi:hypothetical protein BDZ85DRAFT_257225 [Elsinoe ampelina]|uniref:Uncharacterized protein n=1 Tax=Elsinoe ampelina TaxID=302913 RepID=A0A6A6GN34_9PEZI|nr:hypothetical protein BDZ85DRAFT_257225 [Elsinoe ampelina]